MVDRSHQSVQEEKIVRFYSSRRPRILLGSLRELRGLDDRCHSPHVGYLNLCRRTHLRPSFTKFSRPGQTVIFGYYSSFVAPVSTVSSGLGVSPYSPETLTGYEVSVGMN